jgi:hypothetical protein
MSASSSLLMATMNQKSSLREKPKSVSQVLTADMGCKAEESKLRTAERLANLMAVLCIMNWRILWLTMLNRTAAEASPTIALTEIETGLLDRLIAGTGNRRCHPGTLAFYLIKLARLGGYLARSHDPPPGIVVIWRGLSRLTDIELGAEIATPKDVGN